MESKTYSEIKQLLKIEPRDDIWALKLTFTLRHLL